MSFHSLDGPAEDWGTPKFSRGDYIEVGGYRAMITEGPEYGYPIGGGQTAFYYGVETADPNARVYWIRESEMHLVNQDRKGGEISSETIEELHGKNR